MYAEAGMIVRSLAEKRQLRDFLEAFGKEVFNRRGISRPDGFVFRLEHWCLICKYPYDEEMQALDFRLESGQEI
jgi:hypothetical protein